MLHCSTRTKKVREERKARADEVRKNGWWSKWRNAPLEKQLEALDNHFGKNQGAARQRAKIAKRMAARKSADVASAEGEAQAVVEDLTDDNHKKRKRRHSNR